MTTTDRADSRRESRDFLRTTRLVGGAGVTVIVLVALTLEGGRASLAAAVGGALGFAAFEALAVGLSFALRDPARRPGVGALLAGVAFVLRHVVIAAAAFTAVRVLDLPAPWLLAGVTLLPFALTTAGLLTGGLGAPVAPRHAAGAP